MPGRKFSGSNNYRYGFNGKENDNEVVGTGSGTQDYGMRIYNPALGKFLSVDPLTKSYPELTPYQFASNTPISAIDIDGMEANKDYTPGFVKNLQQKIDDPHDLKVLTEKSNSQDLVNRKKAALSKIDEATTYVKTMTSFVSALPGGSIAYFLARRILGSESGEKETKGELLASAGFAILDLTTFGEANSLKLLGTSMKYTPEAAALVKFTGKAIQEGGTAGKEIITVTKTGKFNTALDVAKSILGDLGDDAIEKVGRLGSQEGKTVGWSSADGSKYWRLDYDATKGAHINWVDGNKKGAVLFNATQEAVEKVITNEIPKSLK